MTRRTIQFVEKEFYHVYNRGVDKRAIFTNHSDYVRFQELLFLSNSSGAINVRDIKNNVDSVYLFQKQEKLVYIGGYCLMPNHFHILLTPAVEGGVNKFMGKLSTSYSMYFNKRYERSGSLFQGRFKAQHADSDEYLKYLYSYIHLNPVKLADHQWRETPTIGSAEALAFASHYKYSSLFDYLGQNREETAIIDTEPFPEYFRQATDHRDELFEWLNFKLG